MLRFTRFFSGKFLNFQKCAGVKHLTNIMSIVTITMVTITATTQIHALWDCTSIGALCPNVPKCGRPL